MVIPPGKKLMFQSIPTWPTVDAKGRILETLTLARRLLVAKKCPSVPQWKNPNPKIWKKKTLMSPAWNAWGKLLIAYKATKAQSKGKRKKNIQKEANRKPIVATIFQYNSAEVHWILKVWHHKKLTQKIKVALAPAHQANSLAFALAILALHLGRQQSVHSGVENVDKLISTSLQWKPGRNPELL